MTFDSLTEMRSLKRTSRFEILKIQDGGGGQFEIPANRDVFATV